MPQRKQGKRNMQFQAMFKPYSESYHGSLLKQSSTGLTLASQGVCVCVCVCVIKRERERERERERDYA